MKICLQMIVKNESKIIKRSLESVKNLVDAVYISDTGSDDNTIDIATDLLKDIPHLIEKHDFKDFGYNRTYSHLRMLKYLKELKWDLDSSYSLLMDADHVISFFNRDFSTSYDCIYFKEYNIDGIYLRPRLLKLSKRWRCFRRTHEFWASDEKLTEFISDYSLKHIGDGGSKSDKFDRDLKLLKLDLKDIPNDPRTLFYISCCYKQRKDYDRSIEYMKKAILYEKDDEKNWLYIYTLASIYHHLVKDWGKALEYYHIAYCKRPWRAEPLYAIASEYRKRSMIPLSLHYSEMGLRIPFPESDKMQIQKDIYDYGLFFEFCFSVYYNPARRSEGYIFKKIDMPEKYKKVLTDLYQVLVNSNITESNQPLLPLI